MLMPAGHFKYILNKSIMNKVFFLSLMMIFFVLSCSKSEIDTEKPVIGTDIADAFPLNCDTLYFGEVITVKYLLSDNEELGSMSIEIHHNFDHHSHSTEVGECNLDPKKIPVNTYLFIQDYSLDPGMKEIKTAINITIPDSNSNGKFDDGDYHFTIRLTDREGWSTFKGFSIKMLHR